MGWTETIATHFDKHNNIDRKAEVANIISDHYKILKSVMVGSTWYGAAAHVKKYKKDENGNNIPDGTKNEYGEDNFITEDIPEPKISATVCLTSSRKDGCFKWFGYKMMDEECGPYYFDCPDSILNLLSPTDNEWANRWREGCREYTRKKKELKNLPVGTKIKFNFYDNEKHLVLNAPAYQFKTNWWGEVGKFKYFSKKNIPMTYEVV